jgi:hypothetical protein
MSVQSVEPGLYLTMTENGYESCKHPECENQPRHGVPGLCDQERAYCSGECRVDDVYGCGERAVSQGGWL